MAFEQACSLRTVLATAQAFNTADRQLLTVGSYPPLQAAAASLNLHATAAQTSARHVQDWQVQD